MRRGSTRIPTSIRRARAPPRRRTLAQWMPGPYSFRDLLRAHRRIPAAVRFHAQILTHLVSPCDEVLVIGRWMAALGTINPERCWYRSRRALAWGAARLALDPSFLAGWIPCSSPTNLGAVARSRNLMRWCVLRVRGCAEVLQLLEQSGIPHLRWACVARLRVG
jgi:hypothetical protein